MPHAINTPVLVPGVTEPESKYGLINGLLSPTPLDSHAWVDFTLDESGVIYNLPTCPAGLTEFDNSCEPTAPKSAPHPVYQDTLSQKPIFWEVASFCSTVPQERDHDIRAAAYSHFNGSLELTLEGIYATRIAAAVTILGPQPSILCAYGEALRAGTETPGPTSFLIHVDAVTAVRLLHGGVIEDRGGKLYDKLTDSLVIVWRSTPLPGAIVIEASSRSILYLSDFIELPTPSDEVARSNTRVFRVERGALLIGPEAACAVIAIPYTCG